MWVTFAAGYQSVYQALVLVLAGVVVYAFLKTTGRTPARSRRPLRPERSYEMTFSVQSEAGQLRQVIVHRPGAARAA